MMLESLSHSQSDPVACLGDQAHISLPGIGCRRPWPCRVQATAIRHRLDEKKDGPALTLRRRTP